MFRKHSRASVHQRNKATKASIYPVYFLGFMGKVIYYVETNGGEKLVLSAEEMAELEAYARDTSTDIEREATESSSSGSSSSSSSSNYTFAGWEDWPDQAITGPCVVRAKYNRV